MLNGNEKNGNLMKDRPICPILQGYYQEPVIEKFRHLEYPAATHLFRNLPDEIAITLRGGFLDGKQGKDVPGWGKVIDYFQKNSRIIPELTRDPGTFTMLEKMYHFESVRGEIDEYFLMSVAGGQALKNRYDIVTNYSVAIINQIIDEQGGCLMTDIGSGPGRNGVDITLRNPTFPSRLQIENIEIDDAAIDFGLRLVNQYNLDNIQFVKKSMVKLNGRYAGKVDFGLNVGVVCGMPYRDRVRLLASQLPWFRKGGKLIVAGLTEKMAQDDLLCAYILRETTGWGLQYRPRGELRKAAIEAGWKPVGLFHDEPTRLYDIEILEAA